MLARVPRGIDTLESPTKATKVVYRKGSVSHMTGEGYNRNAEAID
jgi:hypothetical protein